MRVEFLKFLTPNQWLQSLYIHILPCRGCFSIHPFLFSLPQFSLTNAFAIIPPILIIKLFHIIHRYYNISTASISIVKADTHFFKYNGKWFYIGYADEIYDCSQTTIRQVLARYSLTDKTTQSWTNRLCEDQLRFHSCFLSMELEYFLINESNMTSFMLPPASFYFCHIKGISSLFRSLTHPS